MPVSAGIKLSVIVEFLQEIFDDWGGVDLHTKSESIYRLQAVGMYKYVLTKLSGDAGEIKPGEEVRGAGWALSDKNEEGETHLLFFPSLGGGNPIRTTSLKFVAIPLEEPS